MGFSEDTKSLEQSFHATRDLLKQLLSALEQRRSAWVSVRASVLAPSSDIEQLSHQLATEENVRAGLLKRIRLALPTPIGGTVDELHINVTRIAAAMPREQGRALRDAADSVQPLAKMVRAETTLGQRLLRFAKSAQGSIGAELAGVAKSATLPGYDRRARNLNGTRAFGQLVDGRM
jgi:hypothetical protein